MPPQSHASPFKTGSTSIRFQGESVNLPEFAYARMQKSFEKICKLHHGCPVN